MKVLLIDVNCKNGSTGNIVYNLYNYINSSGSEASICYGRGPKIEGKNIFKFGIDVETYLHAFLTRVTGFTGCFSFFSTQRLIRYIKDFNPDIVHIHELHAYFVNIKPLLKYLANKKIKVVHTLHCEFSYTGKCGHSCECERWKAECGKCPHLRDYPSTFWFDHTRHMFITKKRCFKLLEKPIYVVPSTWLYKRVQDSFLNNGEICLVHNGIDTSVFYKRDGADIKTLYNIPLDKKIILAIAPNLMSENKGGHYVLKLAQKMKDVFFILIGADGYQSTMNNVLSLGKIYDKKLLAEFYSIADIFLICSKNENFPTTCIEAVCCGTKVVGFDAGGAKEIATGNLGKFVPYGDMVALEKETRNALDDLDNHFDEFEKISQYYSNERMCSDYYKIYERSVKK